MQGTESGLHWAGTLPPPLTGAFYGADKAPLQAYHYCNDHVIFDMISA